MYSNNQDLATLLKTEFSHLNLREILQRPVLVLQGVGTEIATTLSKLNVETVFDLATSRIFNNAVSIYHAGTDFSSLLYRHGMPTTDMIDPVKIAGKNISDLKVEKIEILAGVDEVLATEIENVLNVSNVRELALFPPFIAAKRILDAIYFPEKLSLFDPEAPTDLIPKSGEFPTERVQYSRVVMGDLIKPINPRQITDIIYQRQKKRNEGDLKVNSLASPFTNFSPIDIIDIQEDKGFQHVALGAIITFTHSWYAQGVALGQLLHSMALAPGESTRIAVIDWSRKSRGRFTESIDEAEDLDAGTTHERSINEVTKAVAEETQNGKSHTESESKTTSSASNISGGVPWISGSRTKSSSESSGFVDSYSTSTGKRDISAEMTQDINDKTHQHAHASRSRRASVVQEVSQSEHERVSTRVVTNYNHMHALTVQYYEVIQIFRTEVRVSKVDPCIFIPFKLINFDRKNTDNIINKYRHILAAGALNSYFRKELLYPSRIELEPIYQLSKSSRSNYGRYASYWSIQEITEITSFYNTPIVESGSRSIYLYDDTVISGIYSSSNKIRVFLKSLNKEKEVYGYLVRDKHGDAPLVHMPLNEPLGNITGISIRSEETEEDEAEVTFSAVTRGKNITFKLNSIKIKDKKGEISLLKFHNFSNYSEELLQHLNVNKAYYTTTILRRLSTSEISMLLAKYTYPVKKTSPGSTEEYVDVPVVELIDPRPIRYTGNFLVFRMGVTDDAKWKAWLDEKGIIVGHAKQDLVPLSSGGVFAEAVLGRFNSAEKLDITRFWNWQDSPIPILPPDIAPVQTGSRAIQEDLRPGQLSAPIVSMVSPTQLPDPVGMAGILSAIQNGNMFRDMSGLANSIALLESNIRTTSAAATAAGDTASRNTIAQIQFWGEAIKAVASMMSMGGVGATSSNISDAGAKINEYDKRDSKISTNSNDLPSTPASITAPQSNNPALDAVTHGPLGEPGKDTVERVIEKTKMPSTPTNNPSNPNTNRPSKSGDGNSRNFTLRVRIKGWNGRLVKAGEFGGLIVNSDSTSANSELPFVGITDGYYLEVYNLLQDGDPKVLRFGSREKDLFDEIPFRLPDNSYTIFADANIIYDTVSVESSSANQAAIHIKSIYGLSNTRQQILNSELSSSFQSQESAGINDFIKASISGTLAQKLGITEGQTITVNRSLEDQIANVITAGEKVTYIIPIPVGLRLSLSEVN